MHSHSQDDLKQLILMSWKERWTETEWSMHARTYLHTPSDVFHVADALVSQAFIGTTPNPLLIQYVWYGINSGLFSYASVITAIAKHDDLHKVESTKELYRLLSNCLSVVNNCSLIEDSMDLCCSLRVILQWLLRNTEQYLKGVSDIFTTTANELLSINCQTLKQLTTGSRSSVLLTIARFEESGIWSHIETDLAVIKTSAGQHALHVEITESCHYVSQLSRPLIAQKPINVSKSVHHLSSSITNLLMLEVTVRKYSKAEGIASQLSLLAQIHGLPMSDLIFHCLRSCFLGFIDAVETGGDKVIDWSAMILLRMPNIFTCLKSSIKSSGVNQQNFEQKSNKWENDLCSALHKIGAMDSLIDSLDQLRNDMDWMKAVTEAFINHGLIEDKAAVQSLLQPKLNKQQIDEDRCSNPLMLLKAETNVESLINALNPSIFASDCERLLKTFQNISLLTKFNALVSAVVTKGQLGALVDQFSQINEAVKTSSGENSKTAQVRAAIFDMSFLILGYIIKVYGKEKVIQSKVPGSMSYARHWYSTWWTESPDIVNNSASEPDASRVEVFLQTLRGSAEFRLALSKWNDICSNLPQAVLEFIVAKQKGYLSSADLTRISNTIRDSLPLSVCLAVVMTLARNARLMQGRSDHLLIIKILADKSQAQSQAIPLYDERFAYYEKLVNHLVGDLLVRNSAANECVMAVTRTASQMLKEALIESSDRGWIISRCLDTFMYTYKYLGIESFSKQLSDFILQSSDLESLKTAFDLVYAVLRIDLLSFTIFFLKRGVDIFFMSEPYTMIDPVGALLAEMVVACLDCSLNDSILLQKSLINNREKLSPFLYEPSAEKLRGNLKVRRLLSCSTEHDLSSSSSSELSPDNPLLVVFSDFVQELWNILNTNTYAPIKSFAFNFIRLCLYSTPLLSRAMKEVIPVEMLKSFSDQLISDSRELLFAASDLGNPEVRRIAAEVICHVNFDN